VSAVSQDRLDTSAAIDEPSWNRGWYEFVSGLALAFAFVEAISAGILLWHGPAQVATVAGQEPSLAVLLSTILMVVVPTMLGYGSYIGLGVWMYRARRRIPDPVGDRSPYRLGSVHIFWATIFVLLATNWFAADHVSTNAKTVGVTAAILRMTIGLTCAWLAVFVRSDILVLLGISEPDADIDEHPDTDIDERSDGDIGDGSDAEISERQGTQAP
jgi:hypothetical protein